MTCSSILLVVMLPFLLHFTLLFVTLLFLALQAFMVLPYLFMFSPFKMKMIVFNCCSLLIFFLCHELLFAFGSVQVGFDFSWILLETFTDVHNY